MQRLAIMDAKGLVNYNASMNLDMQTWIEIFITFSTKWTDIGLLTNGVCQYVMYWRDGRVNVLETRTNALKDYQVYLTEEWENANGIYRNARSVGKVVN